MATAAIGQPLDSFVWRAAIGPATGQDPIGQLLDHECEALGLRLRPGTPVYEEIDDLAIPPRLGTGGSLYWSWPVYVDGVSEGFNWQPYALKEASERLHQLCLLLSVAWDSCWTVREAPVPTITPDVPIAVPAGPGSSAALGGGPPTDEDELAHHPVSLPAWLSAGANCLATRPQVGDAGAVFHQGLLLESRAPSMALIAYVACIERLGEALGGTVERCSECKAVQGSGARSRNAVAAVLAAAEAQELNAAYALRSRTAHQGRLHGGESLLGMWLMPSPFERNEAFDFRWDTLRLARKAARLLLLRQFSEAE
jgi:hypothetical protein